jgi:hypothetical protein
MNAVGIARLGRRVVDAEDELAAEANGTKPHLTSPRPARVASSTQRASTRAAGDDRPSIANGSKKPDPRWKLLDDDDDSVDVAWSKPEDLGADAKATSSSQLLVVTNGREGYRRRPENIAGRQRGIPGRSRPGSIVDRRRRPRRRASRRRGPGRHVGRTSAPRRHGRARVGSHPRGDTRG